MNLPTYKTHFDAYLSTRLDEKLASVQGLFPDEETFSLLTYLKPYVDHGKRFRPYMVYLRYALNGGEDVEYITQVGLIHELIHIFALIHDDICDKGTMRHKIPSYHAQLSTMYDDDHIGQAQALLIGDLVYTWALQEAQQLLTGTQAHSLVFTMLNEVVIGQMLDVHYSTPRDTIRTQEQIATKDHLKSGQYTFQKPMMVGASLAGVTDLTSIEMLGKKIGIAFQMRDDLLDRLPNKEGKTKMSDIQEGNQTVVMTTCRETYPEDARNTLRSQKGKKATPEVLQTLQEDFHSHNIKQLVLERIGVLLDEVEQEFHQLDLSSSGKEAFMQVVEMLRGV